MKLYYSPQACSLASHIALRELGLAFTLVKVDTKTKKSEDGGDFYTINPKGSVAALVLDNGQVLTEAAVILQYLADLKPEARLAPANGSFERVRLQEWLSFISADIHSGCMGPLFNGDIPDGVKEIFRQKLAKCLNHMERTLASQDYLLGNSFTVADALFFTVARWSYVFSYDLSRWPGVVRFIERINARESVKAALAAETGK